MKVVTGGQWFPLLQAESESADREVKLPGLKIGGRGPQLEFSRFPPQ